MPKKPTPKREKDVLTPHTRQILIELYATGLFTRKNLSDACELTPRAIWDAVRPRKPKPRRVAVNSSKVS